MRCATIGRDENIPVIGNNMCKGPKVRRSQISWNRVNKSRGTSMIILVTLKDTKEKGRDGEKTATTRHPNGLVYHHVNTLLWEHKEGASDPAGGVTGGER